MALMLGDQIRFGLHAGPQNVGYPQYLQLWQSAERMGYDWVSVFDHFIPIYSNPEGPCLEGLTLLAAMAAKTERVRCGILVAGTTYRNPAILANMATTIDHISNGRLELGMGAAWWELEHQQYGIPFPSPARRIGMLGEAVKIVKSLWTQPRTTFKGRYYTLTDALNEPKPVQSPHPPLWVGGMGEQLTLRVVAESADGWNTFLMAREAYEHKLEVLAEHCRAVGRDLAEIRKSLTIQVVIGNSEAELSGRIEQVARSRRLTPEDLRRSAIVGSPEACAEQILGFVALGVRDFLISVRAPYDYDSFQLFIDRVVPLVRSEARRKTAGRAV